MLVYWSSTMCCILLSSRHVWTWPHGRLVRKQYRGLTTTILNKQYYSIIILLNVDFVAPVIDINSMVILCQRILIVFKILRYTNVWPGGSSRRSTLTMDTVIILNRISKHVMSQYYTLHYTPYTCCFRTIITLSLLNDKRLIINRWYLKSLKICRNLTIMQKLTHIIKRGNTVDITLLPSVVIEVIYRFIVNYMKRFIITDVTGVGFVFIRK